MLKGVLPRVRQRTLVLIAFALMTFTWVGMITTMTSCEGDCCASPSGCSSSSSAAPVSPPTDNLPEINPDNTVAPRPATRKHRRDKLIVIYNNPWHILPGEGFFDQLHCPETACTVSTDQTQLASSDAVILHAKNLPLPPSLSSQRRPHQFWIFHTMDNPQNTRINIKDYDGFFNWTATYTSDSDLPTPFGLYRPGTTSAQLKPRDFSLGKTRMVAWFNHRCEASPQQEKYVRELSKHVHVDIYGPCGHRECRDMRVCYQMLRQNYRFFLAFEEVDCHDWITRTFWLDALHHDVVPIVMGLSSKQYQYMVPPKSFIHVNDYKTPRLLAKHLRLLAQDKAKYNAYFDWRRRGRIDTVNERMAPLPQAFWCNLCHKLNNNPPRSVHEKLSEWWSVQEQCSNS